MTHASLFSGIGGPEVAAAMLGWENVFHCEINDFCRAILEYHFPQSKSYIDVTKTDFTEWRGRVDVLTGGFPCQPFSYAGRRGGAEDDRYLWPEFERVISEIRPTWVVGENVSGITTMVEPGEVTLMGGEASLFCEEDTVHRYKYEQPFTIERVCSDLEQLGYTVQPMLIPACAVGAPHRRDRVFIIANIENAMFGRQLHGQNDEQGCERNIGNIGTGSCERVCAEVSRIISRHTDTASIGGREIHEHMEPELANGNKPVGNGRERTIADTEKQRSERMRPKQSENCGKKQVKSGGGNSERNTERLLADTTDKRLERQDESRCSEERERLYLRRESARRGGESQQEVAGLGRWDSFPSVSPVHRGNDGLPFPLDCLTISPNKWRTESLKAYGNAIVPQVMYEIFRAIEQVTNQQK